MFARVATFEGVDVSAAEGSFQRIRDAVRPIVEGLPGWQGATQLLDREGGKLVVIQLFDTRENMDAAEQTFEEMPRQIPEAQQVAGRRRSVEKFEVLGDDRR